MTQLKFCSQCNQEKDISEFYKNKANFSALKNSCKKCVTDSGYWKKQYAKYSESQKMNKKSYYERNKEKVKAKVKEYRKNPDVKFKHGLVRLRKETGMSSDEIHEWYNKQFAEQNGCCMICGLHESEIKTRLHIDHNHETGKLRALLCPACNLGIGSLQDDAELCLAAYSYLRET